MVRHALFLLLVGVGIGTQLTCAVEVSVNDTDNKLCLYANLMVNFSVTYEVVGNESNTAVFTLPEQVSTNGSLCDNTSSTLRLGFGDGNSWSVSFTKGDQTYQADSTVFVYNLNDSALFPNATSNETVSVTLKDSFRNVAIDTCYSCKSEEFFQAGDVNQTLWNVLMQAFVSNGSKSENITSCAADLPTTIVAPTTHTSTVTTTLPPPSPTPALPQPTLGEYSVKPDENSTACLLADFGLRVGFKQGEKYVEMNLQPNVTKVRGSCSANSSDLVLTSDTITMMFTFINEAKKFHLHALNITVKPNSGAAFTDSNNNLTLWAASVGSSYMCKKEQVYNITDSLTLFTFDMRVQPFGVSKGGFSTAHECSVDDASILIPIIVGAALAGLILIVVIAYVIGRRKTYVGYQTL